MDANQTPFHLIRGPRDWERLPLKTGLHYDRESHEIILEPVLFRFTRDEETLTRASRRGTVVDSNKRWYWIDETETRILSLPAERGKVEVFWDAHGPIPKDSGSDFSPVGERSLPPEPPLRGMALTEGQDLIVGVAGGLGPDPGEENPGGLLVFDLYAPGTPLFIPWPFPFDPIDMASVPGAGVLILERTHRRETPFRYWTLDQELHVVAPAQLGQDSPNVRDFASGPRAGAGDAAGSRRFACRDAITEDMATSVATPHAVAIEALPGGEVLILSTPPDREASQLFHYDAAGKPVRAVVCTHVPTADPDSDHPPELNIKGHDFAFVPGGKPGELRGMLYIATVEGNQAYAYDLQADRATFETIEPKLIHGYFPMRRYGGKALTVLDDTVYYDFFQADDHQLLPLAPQPRPRFTGKGTLQTWVLDGKERGSVWHRIFLDGRIPKGTSVLIESRSAEKQEHLEGGAWFQEPKLYPRDAGSELPYHQPFTDKEPRSAGWATWETLIQGRKGRFLQLRLTVLGTGRNTPRIRALRTYYIRFSYLKRYLPAIYRDDLKNEAFLERFLANMEGVFTYIEDLIDQVPVLFDSRTAPKDYLPWLASWIGEELDESWEPARKRLFLQHAVSLFSQRGTHLGLMRLIRLAIDPEPDARIFTDDPDLAVNQRTRILEHFQLREPLGAAPVLELDFGSGQADWHPDQGIESLNQRFRDFLAETYTEGDGLSLDQLSRAWDADYRDPGQISFPPLPPAQENALRDFRAFINNRLGFLYTEVAPSDIAFYRLFLARRYKNVENLNAAYHLPRERTLASFGQIELPSDLPLESAALKDWIDFVSQALPIKRRAHRFTILIPAAETEEKTGLRLELVQRIVRREKPAHARFEIRPYLTLFSVGSARVGLESVVGRPQNISPATLGAARLDEPYLARPLFPRFPGRIVTGSDKVGLVL